MLVLQSQCSLRLKGDSGHCQFSIVNRNPTWGRRAENWLTFPSETDKLLADLFRDMKLGLGFSSVTMFVYALTALQVWLVLEELGAEVTLMEAWIAFAVASLAGMLSILPGGLGIWDAALPAILTTQGVNLLSATAATLLLRGLLTLPLGLSAMAAYLFLSRRGYLVPAKKQADGTQRRDVRDKANCS